MATIGLVIKPGIERALELGREVVKWGRKAGHDLLFEQGTAELLHQKRGVAAEKLVHRADPIVILGGDGTLIGVARHVNSHSPLLLGVNFGHLGFLTEVAPSELMTTLRDIFRRKVGIGERNMIQADIFRGREKIFSSQAVNEAVLIKGATDRLMDLDMEVDGEAVMRLRADGVIVATSTGSTAYSLAAGGSIAHPELPVLLVTPLCAHLLASRPLILKLDSEVTLSVPPYDGQVFLSIDGQVSERVLCGDQVKIGRSKHKVRFVRSPSRSYFEILRTKLNWGIANQA